MPLAVFHVTILRFHCPPICARLLVNFYNLVTFTFGLILKDFKVALFSSHAFLSCMFLY